MPVELRHRLIRGTIHNMISIAFNAPFNRTPTTNEVLEMAKSLIIACPTLHDAATGHVSFCVLNNIYFFMQIGPSSPPCFKMRPVV